MKAEWVGGPFDGMTVTLPEGAHFLRVPEESDLFDLDSPLDLREAELRYRDCAVRQIAGKVRVLWDTAP